MDGSKATGVTILRSLISKAPLKIGSPTVISHLTTFNKTLGSTDMRIWPCKQWVFIAYCFTIQLLPIIVAGNCNAVEQDLISNIVPSSTPIGIVKYPKFQITDTGASQTYYDSL